MITRLEWTVQYQNTVLTVEGGTLTIDDQNIPAIAAQVVVPYDAELFAAIDPRQTTPPRIRLQGEQRHWASRKVGDISEFAVAQGGTIADLSSAWTGMTLADVSEQFGSPLWSGATSEPSGRMDMSLHVREISEDGYTMTIDLSSDEALLLDWAFTHVNQVSEFADYQASFNTQEVQGWVRPALLMVLGQDLPPGPYNTDDLSAPDEDILGNVYASNIWESVIRPVIDDTNLKLRVHPDGRTFSLERPVNTINPPASHSWLFRASTVISARNIYSRLGDWYDSAALTKDLSTGLGLTGFPAGQHSRTYKEHFGESDATPTASMAQNIAVRGRNRGRLIELTVPAQLKASGPVFMRDEFTYLPEGAEPGGGEYSWQVKSVGYDFQTATMRIRGERPY